MAYGGNKYSGEDNLLDASNINTQGKSLTDLIDLSNKAFSTDKEKNAAIYDRAFAKLNASLMPIDDIKEGSLYVEPSSLEVVLTPDDNSKKISSKGKKSKK